MNMLLRKKPEELCYALSHDEEKAVEDRSVSEAGWDGARASVARVIQHSP